MKKLYSYRDDEMMDTEWKKYLLQQASLHPAMEPQDVYKLMFQAAFGAEHLLKDTDAAWSFFQKEYEQVQPGNELLYEQIQDNLFRVNLGAWKRKGLPAEWLFRMFVGSVNGPVEGREVFLQYEAIAKSMVLQGDFSFSDSEFREYSEEYECKGVGPVHHSQHYREEEKPAYRLVRGEYLRLLPLLERMAVYLHDSETEGSTMPMIIAVDGRCASGKTTMARMLAEVTDAGVIHMDDFFLPKELRTKERLSEPGGNVHYERFCETVLPKLKQKSAFAYTRFDCSRMQLGEERMVSATDFRIVEGAYSCHPKFGKYYDLGVFSDVDEKMQEKRILCREGAEALQMFKERWIPLEEHYFQAYSIREGVDIVV